MRKGNGGVNKKLNVLQEGSSPAGSPEADGRLGGGASGSPANEARLGAGSAAAAGASGAAGGGGGGGGSAAKGLMGSSPCDIQLSEDALESSVLRCARGSRAVR